MPADVHTVAADRLRADAQRYTSGRRRLVDVLVTAPHPLTIPEIVEGDARLALSSVYRNLATLERSGVVHKIITRNEFAAYELAEDLTEHHHHLICTACGKVEDFTASPGLERSTADALRRIAGRAGFEVTGHRIDAVGLCRACA